MGRELTAADVARESWESLPLDLPALETIRKALPGTSSKAHQRAIREERAAGRAPTTDRAPRGLSGRADHPRRG